MPSRGLGAVRVDGGVTQAERPVSLTWFDRLFAVLVVLIAINSALRWRLAVSVMRADDGATSTVIDNAETIVGVVFAGVIGLLTLVWWLASRRRSRIAWLSLSAIFLIMATVGTYNFSTQVYSWQLTMWSSAAQICAYFAGFFLLMLPSTWRWFRQDIAGGQLKDTFS